MAILYLPLAGTRLVAWVEVFPLLVLQLVVVRLSIDFCFFFRFQFHEDAEVKAEDMLGNDDFDI